MLFLDELNHWMDDHSAPQVVWYLKRLTANDTTAGGSNQAGPYIPRDFLLEVFPRLNRRDVRNPDLNFSLQIDSPSEPTPPFDVRAVWYNNQLFGGTRNETRVTGFGGADSPLLDPDSTGALAVFAFHRPTGQGVANCHVWICRNEVDEDIIEARTGTVQPGEWRMWTTGKAPLIAADRRGAGCWLQPHEIPAAWLEEFPGGEEIIQHAVQAGPPLTHDIDKRLMTRRVCEFQIYQSLEEAVELPVIRAGFNSIESFVSRAQSILQ
ncbi:MAG: EcoRII N-terminal effector-binding domain-containing protein, partial [Pirellulaceae bacterium]